MFATFILNEKVSKFSDSDFKILVNFMKLSLHFNPVTALLKNGLKNILKILLKNLLKKKNIELIMEI